MMQAAQSTTNNARVVLILVGLPGSGKSTFASALERHFAYFRRCNQDDLGNRRKVERMARRCLQRGDSVCVDRVNFDAQQRAHWIKIAGEFPGTVIWVLVFDTPYDVCAARLLTRTGHPTIVNPEVGLSVLARMTTDFQLPASTEGYHSLVALKVTEQSETYTRPEIEGILQRLRSATVQSQPKKLTAVSADKPNEVPPVN